jgi:hypothetical protein
MGSYNPNLSRELSFLNGLGIPEKKFVDYQHMQFEALVKHAYAEVGIEVVDEKLNFAAGHTSVLFAWTLGRDIYTHSRKIKPPPKQLTFDITDEPEKDGYAR